MNSSHGMRLRIAVQAPWHESLEFANTAFLRSWLFHGSAAGDTASRINWNAVLGLLLVTGISAGFWTGVGFAIAQVWR